MASQDCILSLLFMISEPLVLPLQHSVPVFSSKFPLLPPRSFQQPIITLSASSLAFAKKYGRTGMETPIKTGTSAREWTQSYSVLPFSSNRKEFTVCLLYIFLILSVTLYIVQCNHRCQIVFAILNGWTISISPCSVISISQYDINTLFF